jgi:hypothetical protein
VRRSPLAAVLAAAALLLVNCSDSLTQDCPPLAHPPVLTVVAATNPCQAKGGESAKQLELRVVQKYQRSQPPNPGGPTYPLRCGTTKYGYLHMLDQMSQGQHDHCDPVNDAECQAEIAYTLEHGKPVIQVGATTDTPSSTTTPRAPAGTVTGASAWSSPQTCP